MIAEGIENRATADLLVGMGCEEGQGYFFGRPMPAAEFEARFLTAQDVAALFCRAAKRHDIATGLTSEWQTIR